MLTAEELEFIKKDAEAKWKNTQAPIDVLIQAAYDYGRRVKPLVWVENVLPLASNWHSGRYRISFVPRDKWVVFFEVNYIIFSMFDTADEAKLACQKHHNKFILGALE